ncbi:hypothetical protein NZ698_06250 [Chryseobacterium sp. PBS4-4]|uniref:IrrE N-terminal-like domain-containing protein n=1 Tax=Chryseobacterium edaphi TaxID=2976532 RepID=A0ABT2W4A7_9FLAO|nr:hypothetical protein [Chryseobacterium edaphi]MCU7616793.1 hypothetical protein [Chryseobacterium edaphi]
MIWTKKQTVNQQKEFARLKEDGHIFIEDKRKFCSRIKIESSRYTQLYRTLLHEFGHYVHYLEVVERSGNEDENYEEKERREDYYFKLPKSEKERFANKYADHWRKIIIP